MVKGLFDKEVKEELLSQTPELNLDQSLAFVEAKEQGKQSQRALEESGLASSQVNKVTAYQRDKKETLMHDKDETRQRCRFCGKLGHDENPVRTV